MAPYWNRLDSIMDAGNVNHDGLGDLVARTASGSMLLYPGNGRAIVSRLAR